MLVRFAISLHTIGFSIVLGNYLLYFCLGLVQSIAVHILLFENKAIFYCFIVNRSWSIRYYSFLERQIYVTVLADSLLPFWENVRSYNTIASNFVGLFSYSDSTGAIVNEILGRMSYLDETST